MKIITHRIKIKSANDKTMCLTYVLNIGVPFN